MPDPRSSSVLLELLRAMRPQHWVKNVFVFAPLVFALRLTDVNLALRVLAAFGTFCAIASAVYLFNDTIDRKADRLHPEKRLRPIAAGRISVWLAATATVVLAAIALIGGWLLADKLAMVLGAYLLMNISYSLALKRVVVLDVMMISAGFLLRAWAGAVVIDVEMSHWLALCTGLIALFLGFVKRRQELVSLSGQEAEQRPILREYSLPFLDQMISTVTAGTILGYSLYAFSPEVAGRLGTDWMGITIPFVVYGVFRCLYLVYQKGQGQNPTALVLGDRPLQLNVVLWAIVTGLVLYTSRLS
jgi:4-hydroxybenzoate polyprenyltransferase